MNKPMYWTKFGLGTIILVVSLVLWMGLSNKRGQSTAGKQGDEAKPHSSPKPVAKATKVAKSSTPEVHQNHNGTPGLLDEFKSVRLLEITPEKARELIARCKAEVTNIDERRQLSFVIISALCNRGYTSEAWSLIERDSGDVRDGELLAFFQNTTLSFKDRCVYLDELTTPSDRTSAISGLTNVPIEQLHEVNFDDILVSSIQEKNSISSGIASAISWLGSPRSKIPNGMELTRKLLEKSAALVRADKLDASHLAKILQADLGNDGFYHWNFLDSVKRGFAPRDYQQLQAAVVPQMIQDDANRAMQIICSDPSSMGSGAVISQAIEAWYLADSQGANAWVTRNLAEQSSSTKNLILASVARVALNDGDFKTALQWAGQMSDPQLKEKVEGIIRTKRDNSQK